MVVGHSPSNVSHYDNPLNITIRFITGYLASENKAWFLSWHVLFDLCMIWILIWFLVVFLRKQECPILHVWLYTVLSGLTSSWSHREPGPDLFAKSGFKKVLYQAFLSGKYIKRSLWYSIDSLNCLGSKMLFSWKKKLARRLVYRFP